MKIYQAKAWFERMEIIGEEVLKETEKQYKTQHRIIRKEMIGKYDKYRIGYGFTKEEAIEAAKKCIANKIETHKVAISSLEKALEYPIKEINCD